MLTSAPTIPRSGIYFQKELGRTENGPSYDLYTGHTLGSAADYGAIEAPIASPIIVPTRVTRAGVSHNL